MAVFPAMAETVTRSGVIPAWAHTWAVSSCIASRTQPERAFMPPLMACCSREITSAPYWLWGFLRLAWASTAPEWPSRR